MTEGNDIPLPEDVPSLAQSLHTQASALREQARSHFRLILWLLGIGIVVIILLPSGLAAVDKLVLEWLGGADARAFNELKAEREQKIAQLNAELQAIGQERLPELVGQINTKLEGVGTVWLEATGLEGVEGSLTSLRSTGKLMIAEGEDSDGNTLAAWSDNGGTSWQVVSNLSEIGDVGEFFVIGEHFVAVGGGRNSSSLAVWSNDGGKSWQVSSGLEEVEGFLSDITVVGERLVAVGGRRDGSILAAWSDDRGKSWQVSSGPEEVEGFLSDITVVGERLVAVGGAEIQVL